MAYFCCIYSLYPQRVQADLHITPNSGMLPTKAVMTCLFTGILVFCLSAQPVPHVESLGINNGLSQGFITALLQDSQGFLWIGTKNGLNRYDGHEIKVFAPVPLKEHNTLSGDWVRSLCEYGDYILIGLGNRGLNILDKRTLQVHRLWSEQIPDPFLSESIVRDFMVDARGDIWFMARLPSREAGLVRMLTKGKPFDIQGDEEIKVDGDVFEIGDDQSLQFVLDGTGQTIWQERSGKLFRSALDPVKWEEVPWPDEDPGARTLAFGTSDQGSVWLSKENKAYFYNGRSWKKNTFEFTVRELVWSEKNNRKLFRDQNRVIEFEGDLPEKPVIGAADAQTVITIPKKGVGKIFIDRSGVIWCGTSGYGLYKYDPRKQRFKHYFPEKSINYAPFIDEKGQIFWSVLKGTFGMFFASNPSRAIAELPVEETLKFEFDRQKKGWLLTHNFLTGEVILLKSDASGDFSACFSLKMDGYFWATFTIDDQGHIWIANSRQLACYRPEDGTHSNYALDYPLGDLTRVTDICRTPNGHLWIGTEEGLMEAVPQKDDFQFKLHAVLPDQENCLPNNNVSALFRDPSRPDHLWVATKGGGVCVLDTRTMEFAYLNMDRSLLPGGGKLPNDVIYGLLPDDFGNLWMSSNKGIIRYNLQSGAVRSYTAEDGLPTNEFNTRAFTKGANGRIAFGSVEGLIVFDPADFLQDNPFVPNVCFTGLEVNNKRIIFGDSTGILSASMEYAPGIRLPYSLNNVTLEFAGLEFSSPTKNKFEYYLKGAEPPWAHESTENRASYLNLQPGRYTFLVRGANGDGVWNNDVSSIQILIRPPWYRSNPAYFLYSLLIAAAAYGIFRFLLYRQKLQYKLDMEKNEADRLKELDAFKSRFYTNITHEFRTPLTVIQGMAREIQDADQQQPVGRWQKAVRLIENNGSALLRLINQMLDLAKLEAGALKLNRVKADFAAHFRNLAGSFESLADAKRINWEYDADIDRLEMAFDQEQVNSILTNLISNAVKFTPPDGEILIRLTQTREWRLQLPADFYIAVTPPDLQISRFVSLSVVNSGPGIDPEALPRIFDRFSGSNDQKVQPGKGTGIGLALVKELVTLMNGGLAVRSIPGKETEFKVLLPVTEDADSFQAGYSIADRLSQPAPISDAINDQHKINPADSNSPTLLVIEDNPDVRQYLVACFEGLYRLRVAQNGEDGIAIALETVPDIIVSDVIMPLKDGFEVVDTLKNDERTSHIPIVLLTAKADVASRIEGLQRGADVYLAKPFYKEELLLNIRNLLELRKKFQERYADWQFSKQVQQPDKDLSAAMEDAFILKVRQALIENLSDEHFGVSELCRAVGISRTPLHNKLKALTGKSTTLFIRFLRLQLAREMLLTTGKTVSEIACEVGFSYVQNFSKYYQQEFGESPSHTRS